jgi:DNA-directed RNA polymerase II subunit RPB1
MSNELEYTDNIREIIGVQFSIINPEEIKRRSVVNVTQTVLYDSGGDPIVCGLFDPRMGVLDHGKICPTDNLDNRFCPGYFGHIELVKPVFHIQFLPMIIKILKCICIRCSNLLVDISNPEIQNIFKNNKKDILNYVIEKSSKIKFCGTDTECGCGAIQPTKFVKEGLAKIYAEWKDKSLEDKVQNNKQLLTAEFISKIFRRITNKDCEYMGLSPKWCRPEWMICTYLPVAPPSVRPSVKQQSGTRSEDDITHKYIDIIKTNNHLKKKMENSESLENTIDEWIQVLQYHVATILDNELPGVNVAIHRSGRALKTLKQRLKGKEGRLRGNLMGKRVNFSARSVITPDPNIRIDQLGVPYKIAMNLTIPEIVSKFNKNKLYKIIRNGPFKHPGAKSLKKKIDNKTCSLQYVDVNNIILNEGDIVYRHLIDGDVVLFNRQPSLHKMSMMAHKVKVMKYDTFRLNVSVTKPYNADFDGDEMNMHVPQSLQTRAELLHLAYVPLQIISPREHKPVISLVQDTLLGIYKMTDDNIYLNKVEMMNILIYIDNFDGVLSKPEITKPERWSGRQLLSIILPKDLNMDIKNNSYDDSHPDGDDKLNHVIIKNGIILQGRLDSKVVNSGNKGLIHIVFNNYGYKMAQQILDNIQNIITRYLVITGFSVGIGDLVANSETNDKISKIIVNTKKRVSKLNTQVHKQMFDDTSASSNAHNDFEKKVNNLLNKAISEAGNIALKSLNKNNRMIDMVSAGSKGKIINIAQMIACLGQQNVDGKRIPNSYNNRTLPHFSKYDISPEAKGFVQNSFIKGLSPWEFYFHAMGGREGLIDTAVKTSETGYIQRKLVKAMEDDKIYHDLSVRNAHGNIIQFLYGEDGMDYIKIVNQQCDLLSKSYEEIEKIHKFREDNFSNYLTKNIISEIKSDKSFNNKIDTFYNQLIEKYHKLKGDIFKNSIDEIVRFPINLYSLIIRIKNTFLIKKTVLLNLSPSYIIDKIYELEDYIYSNNGSYLFVCLLYSYLSPKKILKQFKLNRLSFDYLVEQIKMEYINSYISVSEMVGPIAAQSIGEPATQMTLNTFHFAGVSSKSNVTRGVPRLKELLHISRNIKAPSTTIYLDEQHKYDKTMANKVLNMIELTTTKEIIKSINIHFDPYDGNTTIKEDEQILEIYKLFQEMDPLFKTDTTGSDWVIRIVFDKQTMINKNITMEDIYYNINELYSDELSCVYSDDNSNNLIFRIRVLKMRKTERINDINLLKQIACEIREKVIIKGIKDIESVSMFKNKFNTQLVANTYTKKEEWVLNTNGVNFIDICNNKYVDYTRSYSNDIYEMYELLGIEATRSILLSEIKEVIESSGNYVNYRHLSLLCDIMTNKGDLMSIDRFGINRGDNGPLAKCSFEETTDQLFKASIFGELDTLTGVSANIMMGQIPPCGTGDTDIMIDESKIIDIEGDEETNLEIDNLEEWITEDYCTENIGINFSSDTIKGTNSENIPMPDIEI